MHYVGFKSWTGNWHHSQVVHKKLWAGASVRYRLEQVSNIQKFKSSIFKVDHQSICDGFEALNLPVGLRSTGEGFPQEGAPFDLLTNDIHGVVLLLQYWVTIIDVDVALGLNEEKSLVADIALNAFDVVIA